MACQRGSVGKWPLSATHLFFSMRYSHRCNPPKMLLGKVNLRMKYSEREGFNPNSFAVVGICYDGLQFQDSVRFLDVLITNAWHKLLLPYLGLTWGIKRGALPSASMALQRVSQNIFPLTKARFKLPQSPWGWLLCWGKWWCSSELSHSGKGYNDAVL